MIVTGTAVAFLLVVCGILPFLAVRSAGHLGEGALPITREQLFAQVIGTQAFLFGIAWFTARENGIELWSAPRALAWPAGAVLLSAALLLLRLRWPSRTASSKARLYSMLPHDARERRPYVAVCVAAGIAEEMVYRGVLVTLLTSYLRSAVVAAVIAATVFGISHSIQGLRAVIATAAIAVAMQILVAFAGSLIPAMVVHAIYDFVAGIVIPRWYERDVAIAATPSDAAPAADR